jgi:hypothetical protein
MNRTSENFVRSGIGVWARDDDLNNFVIIESRCRIRTSYIGAELWNGFGDELRILRIRIEGTARFSYR